MLLSLEMVSASLQQLGIRAAAANALLATARLRHLPKQGLWLERGRVASAIAIVAEGALAQFYPLDGEEKACYIATRGALLTAVSSFVYQRPAAEQIASLVETQLYEISRADYYAWVEGRPEGWRDHARLLEYQLACVDDSRREAISLTAAERYQRLLAAEPATIREAPLHVIADVLGISAQHLSRIRRALAQGG